MNNYLKDGTTVSFRLPNMGDKVYLGVVRGVSTIELPEIGATYILEVLNVEFPNETYPYSFISLPENQFKVVKQGFPVEDPEPDSEPSFKDLLLKLADGVSTRALKFKTFES